MQNASLGHQEKLRLELIQEKEGTISAYRDELKCLPSDHWRAKETKFLLDDAIEKKEQLITHYNEAFGKDYSTDLNQALSDYRYAKELSERYLDEEYRVACMYSQEEAKKASEHYSELAKGYKKELQSKFNHTV